MKLNAAWYYTGSLWTTPALHLCNNTPHRRGGKSYLDKTKGLPESWKVALLLTLRCFLVEL